MLKQQQEILEKHPKMPEQNTKGLHTNLYLFIGMDFIQNRVNTPLLPWDPTRNHQTWGYSENKVSLIFTSLLKQVDLYRAFK